MITFLEDRCVNYQHRTFMNIELSEITIIFAVDLTTAGEKCTLNYCKICERPVFVFNINERGSLGHENQETISNLVKHIKNYGITRINIAGNGIYTFNKHGISQERVNDLVYNLLSFLIKTKGCGINKIRSGGQTGADEAGLVAGDKLGLKTTSLCPKGWRFRTIENKDVYSQEEFKARFKI